MALGLLNKIKFNLAAISFAPLQTLHISKTLLPRPKMSSWACSKCTFMNPPSQKPACLMCQSAQSTSDSPTFITKPKWSCRACTFLNKFNEDNCEICGTRASASLLSSLSNIDDLDELGSSVGDVFFPLRACSNSSSQNIKKIRENSDGDGVECGDNNDGFQGLKATNKEVISVGNPNKRKIRDNSNGDGDEFGDNNVGFQGLKAAYKEVILAGNQNKRKIRDNSDGDGVEFGDSSGGFRSLKVATKKVVSVERSPAKDNSSKSTQSLKILSYNIWFREDLEMQARMDAIGDLIWQHNPDIMCFQEVTSDSYEMFQKSSWWKLYKCSVSREMTVVNPYFCIQLCKLPVKRYSCKPFAITAMGRELCVAEVDVGANKTLVVATSHLESPCPGPPTWDQMYSKERVAQAKEAIRHLEKHPNVIFCGDMNWDDRLDGEFPLPDGWYDAWVKIRPQEDGWTYDTKSNKMLSANRTLRKRLDRCICNLQDFKLSGIEMIGTEEIQGLSYCKEKKVKNQVKQITLPVLPSDHYGLLLTICLNE